jgi:phospholipid-binding lipoprotein MlaA
MKVPTFNARRALVLFVLSSVSIVGCAHPPPASDPEAVADYQQTDDPLEPTNRVLYSVNNGIDAVILKPAAEAYKYGLPQPVQGIVHNVVTNFSMPSIFFDDVMQTKPRQAGDSFMRFLINSTVGLGGLFDVATGWGWPEHENSFGTTLALWGVPAGPYLFLPLLGPSDPRDGIGLGVDTGDNPFNWIGRGTAVLALQWGEYGVYAVDARARALDLVDNIQKTALDPYATFRSLYRQHRSAQIAAARQDSPATVPAWFPKPAAPSPTP